MAEFGVQATQLSAPSGAGTGSIAPATAGILDNGVGNLIGGIFQTFAKGLQADQRAQAEAMKQGVVSSYTKKQAAINSAVASGGISPSEAGMRSRKLFNEYAAGNSEYIGDIENAAKALRGFSEMGEAEAKVKEEQDLNKSRISAAQSAGYPITKGMDQSTIDKMVDAHQTSVRVDAELSRSYRKTEADRAAGKYNQEVNDREQKTLGLRLINEIADTNLDASGSYAQQLGKDMRANKLTPEAAQMEWSRYTGRIMAQLQSAAGMNPELAAPYRTLFDSMIKTGQGILDPKADADKLDAEIKMIVNRSKLLALQEPGIASTVAASQLLGQNAELGLAASGSVVRLMAKMGVTGVTESHTIPPIMGDKEVEKGVLGMTKASIDKLYTKSYTDEPKAKKELENTINLTLSQIGDSLGKPGADAKYLKGVADFIASPQFGKYATEHPLDASALSAASKTFKLQYESQIVRGIDQQLSTVIKQQVSVPEPEGRSGPRGQVAQTVRKPFDISNVNVVFNGTGVSFAMKNTPVNPAERAGSQAVITQLNAAQAGVNQLIHIGAHMSGTTNYAKFWEENKHVILPRMFSKYEGLEIGQVVDGKTYIGGDASDANNWK